jgi:hypothetical protein
LESPQRPYKVPYFSSELIHRIAPKQIDKRVINRTDLNDYKIQVRDELFDSSVKIVPSLF